jgi:DNA invertase Pin-like site-specific DNA recombinase
MKRIALYTRRSLYSEVSESIKMQLQACRDYFKNEECEFEEFIDEGYSGSNTDRPAFNRMVSKIHNNEFDAVVVYKIDRISRKMVDFINLVNDFENYGVPLISVTEGADPTTPAGKFVMNILASMAEMERANTIQRVTDNMLLLAKQGRWTGGNTPIGYKSIKTNFGGRKQTYLTVDETESEVAIAIFNKYIECKSLNETARYISDNYRSISVATVSNTLSSPVYAPSTDRIHEYLKLKGFTVVGEPTGKGYITYGKRPKVKNRKQWNNKGYIVAVSLHDPLIDEDSWLRVQNILEKNSIEPRPKESAYSYLNTLVKCARCGSNMVIELTYTRADGTKVYSFACGKRKKKSTLCDNGYVMVDELEKSIEDKLKYIGVSKNRLNEFISNNNKKDHSKEIKSIKKKIEKNNIQISNLTDKLALLSNEASKMIIKKIEQLTSDNIKLQKKLVAIENIEAIKKNNESKIHALYDSIKLFNSMRDATIEQKRELIRTIIERIDFDKDENIAKITLRT